MEDNNIIISPTENKRKCIFCKKTIKKFTSSTDNPNRKVHRKCWLKHRKFEDRCYDYFFTERKESKLKVDKKSKFEYQSIKPTHQPNSQLNSLPAPSPPQTNQDQQSLQEKNTQ